MIYPMYDNKETCERCHKPVDRDKAVWFELSSCGDWYEPGVICEEDSQGEFAFGPDCAKEVSKNPTNWEYVGLAKKNRA